MRIEDMLDDGWLKVSIGSDEHIENLRLGDLVAWIEEDIRRQNENT